MGWGPGGPGGPAGPAGPTGPGSPGGGGGGGGAGSPPGPLAPPPGGTGAAISNTQYNNGLNPTLVVDNLSFYYCLCKSWSLAWYCRLTDHKRLWLLVHLYRLANCK